MIQSFLYLLRKRPLSCAKDSYILLVLRDNAFVNSSKEYLVTGNLLKNGKSSTACNAWAKRKELRWPPKYLPYESNVVYNLETLQWMFDTFNSPNLKRALDTVPISYEGKTLVEYFQHSRSNTV